MRICRKRSKHAIGRPALDPRINSARQALLDEAEVFERQATELEIREHKRAPREVAAFSLERSRQSAARRRGDRPG